VEGPEGGKVEVEGGGRGVGARAEGQGQTQGARADQAGAVRQLHDPEGQARIGKLPKPGILPLLGFLVL
jgi:hypothetical protein